MPQPRRGFGHPSCSRGVARGRAVWGCGGGESRASGVSKPWLRLGHCFKADASPVDVSEWAKDVVDQIKLALDLQTPVIEEHNVRVLPLVQTLIAARRCDIEKTPGRDPVAAEASARSSGRRTRFTPTGGLIVQR